MKKVMLVFGTRPEAIKMCPLVRELRQREGIEVCVCVTGQHRELLDGALRIFGLTPDIDLAVMRERQELFDVTHEVLFGVREAIDREKPHLILVHGDTTTAFAAALAGFYRRIPVGHVEAGLRTDDILNPYPEEFNRRAISSMASIHFAPTEAAKANLLREGIPSDRIYITGNTVIDALATTVRPDYTHPLLEWAGDNRIVLLTAHRRENLGMPLRNMLRAIRRVCDEREEIRVIYPVHPNPAVREAASEVLGSHGRIRLTEPLDVFDFHNILARSFMVLTDSGGVQEEAPALGKPVLLMRNTTERPEGVSSGTVRLVGTHTENIYREIRRLLEDGEAYATMSKASSPYGDGHASERIADVLCDLLK